MTYRELGKYFKDKYIEYYIKQEYSHDLAIWGAMIDSVNYLMINSKNNDRKFASDIVYEFCIGSFNKILTIK